MEGRHDKKVRGREQPELLPQSPSRREELSAASYLSDCQSFLSCYFFFTYSEIILDLQEVAEIVGFPCSLHLASLNI